MITLNLDPFSKIADRYTGVFRVSGKHREGFSFFFFLCE